MGTARCDSGAKTGKRSIIFNIIVTTILCCILPTRLDRYSTAAICHHVLLRHRRTGTALLHHSLHQQASSQGAMRNEFLLEGTVFALAGRKAGRQAGGCNVPGPRFTSAFGHLISSSAPPASHAIHCHTQHRKQDLAQAKSTIAPETRRRRKRGQISDLIVFYCYCACVLSSASSAPKTQRFRLVMRRSIPWMKRPP